MILLRRLPRCEWEKTLRSYECEPLQGKGKLNTAEWWRMPWQDYPFTVPVENDCITQLDMDDLIVRIATSAPEGWEFPDD